jgi:hypothetical protein
MHGTNVTVTLSINVISHKMHVKKLVQCAAVLINISWKLSFDYIMIFNRTRARLFGLFYPSRN